MGAIKAEYTIDHLSLLRAQGTVTPWYRAASSTARNLLDLLRFFAQIAPFLYPRANLKAGPLITSELHPRIKVK
jgi:hypothetical protein